MRKKLGGTYKRENFLSSEKRRFGLITLDTTDHIELILVPIDQKLAELTNRIRNFSGKASEKIF